MIDGGPCGDSSWLTFVAVVLTLDNAGADRCSSIIGLPGEAVIATYAGGSVDTVMSGFCCAVT